MRVLVAVLALAMAGCAMGPAYHRPVVPVPERFYGQAQVAEAASLADTPWWDVLADPVLRSLIEDALRSGYDARVAAARVEAARARYGVAQAALYPGLDYRAQVQAGRKPKTSSSASDSSSDDDAPLVTVGLGLSWEVDLWGRLRRSSESARAQYLASEEARRGVLLTLLSDVATGYLDLRELDEELQVARDAAAGFEDVHQLFARRLEGGAASGLETARAEAALANARAQIPLLERRIVATEARIALLLGRGPGPVERGADLAHLALPPEIPVGLPSALLERRPDVRAAEQRLRSANAAVGAAQAALFPTLSLTGLLGGVSSELSELFGDGRTWSLTGGLLGPLFHGGSLRRQRRIALAGWEEARAEYERAVTAAFGEVATALVGYQKLHEAEGERMRAVAADQEAVRLANLRYTSGYSAYFEVLDAMQQLFSAEIALAQTRRDRLEALVQLYRALGGGWPLISTTSSTPPGPSGP
jgi:multidrug efflux system outer membrane protein